MDRHLWGSDRIFSSRFLLRIRFYFLSEKKCLILSLEIFASVKLLIVEVSHCRFRSITKQYFRKADGVVVMYDVTSETSFTNVRNWMTSVQVRNLI